MTTLTDRLGKQNPQLLREFRGRLKPRSVTAAVALSFIFQLLLYFSVKDAQAPLSPYAIIYSALSWTLPYALFVLGGYYIVDDLTREEKTGTLNFIRLSPRPAREILWGKLLGAPILPIIMVLSAVPLHLLSGLLAGESFAHIASYYLLLVAGAGFVFSLALLFGLVGSASALGKRQAVGAIAFAGLAVFAITPMFMLWNQIVVSPAMGESILSDGYSNGNLEWLYLPLMNNALLAHLFTIGNLAIASLLIWQISLRKFRMPTATPISKYLSYIGVIYLNVLTWGFSQSSQISISDSTGGSAAFAVAMAMYVLNIGLFLVLMFALAPSRQTLLEWQRYRRSSAFSLKDWLWNDSSPSLGAIAVNFLIAAALIVPWLFVIDPDGDISTVGGLLATLSMLITCLIYAAIVQIIYSTRLRSPQIWAAGIISTIIAVTAISLSILSIDADPSRLMMALWTFCGIPIGFLADAIAEESGFSVIGGVVMGVTAQVIVLGLLSTRLRQNLKQLAPRTTKASVD